MEAPMDSYVSLKVEGAEEAFVSWNAEFKDEEGVVQNFGPYTQELVLIPGKDILGTRKDGIYTVTMTGVTANGKTIRKFGNARMVLWAPPVAQVATRYSVLYEFDESQAEPSYEKYLREVVAPRVPQAATVILHGYTDIIGEPKHNVELSRARANDVKAILASALAKTGTQDVKYQVYGSGEDPKAAQFSNKFPEERVYNRTVVIDIVPAK
jgi:outer membrane protein OmpA-like peptidoglycan-associated protein